MQPDLVALLRGAAERLRKLRHAIGTDKNVARTPRARSPSRSASVSSPDGPSSKVSAIQPFSALPQRARGTQKARKTAAASAAESSRFILIPRF